jgi:hypothetical protein
LLVAWSRGQFDTRRNRILLVAASFGISAFVGGLALWWLWPSPAPPGIASEFSFYDQWGRPVSGRVGRLKLVLDPATIYANWPGQREDTFTVDDDGFRATPRRPGRPQIVLLGGSAAFGWLLPSDQATFAWRLAERMTTYDVINAAVIGFQSAQELSLVVHRLDNPHVTAYVAFDAWNDLFDPVVDSTLMRPLPVLGFNNTFLVIQDQLWDFYRSQEGAVAERRRLVSPRLPQMPMDAYAGLVTETYLRNVERMHAFARARGAHFLLVLQPEVGSKPLPSAEERDTLARWERLKGYVRSGFPERYATMRKAATEFCAGRGIPSLDVSSAQEFRAEDATLFIDAVHLNERGNRLVSDLIERRLRERR